MGLRGKQGWLRIVEAFIAVFLIISVALFVINKGYIEQRDISEKIYAAEVQLLQEIVDEFGESELDYSGDLGPDEIGDFIDIEGNRRIPVYLDCGIALCKIENLDCEDYYPNEPDDNIDHYVQSLPIIDTDSLLKINCWLK